MSKFWIILLHTFFSKLKGKSFIITTIIMLVIIAGLANITNIIDYFDNKEEAEKIAVIDETENLFEPLSAQFEAMNEDFELVLYKDGEKKAEKAVEQGEYKGLLILTLDDESLPKATYKAMSVSDISSTMAIENSLQQIKTGMAANQINLTQEQLAKLYEPVEMEKIALEENAKTAEELNQARGLVYVLLFVIYFAVIMYANMIAMEVATEKSSRVMEILISSVSPIQQMFAKILGVALLSLTQMALMLGVGYYFIKKNLENLEEGFFSVFGFGDVPVATIIYAIVFFVLGYFLYATLAAFLGSLVSRLEDINQMIMPMTFLVVAGFLIAMIGLTNPETTFMTISSYIPFFTPMLMFMRVGMLNLPVWEPILGIVVMVITIVILAIFGARVYKGGVLMYGKSTSFKDVKKALQLTKNE